MSDIKIKQPRITQTNIIIVSLFIIIVALGTTITLINFNFQDRRINDDVVKNLTKQVSLSNSAHLNQTQYILNETLSKANENYQTVLHALNDSNTFIKFLSDNFGEESDYLKKENFQYAQANQSTAYEKQQLANQAKGLQNQKIVMDNIKDILDILKNGTK